MAYFKINEPNKEPKWIKSVDTANGTLEFQNSRDNAWYKDSGFFADSEAQFLKFHFKEQYPELEYLSVDCSYGRQNETEPINHLVGQQIQDMPVAPNDPWVVVEEEAPQHINQIAYTVGVANPVMEARAAAIEADLPWGDGINEEAPRPIYYNRAYVE